MKWTTVAILLTMVSIAEASSVPGYKKSSSACSSCKAIGEITAKYSSVVNTKPEMDYIMKLADVIKKISLKGKPQEDQRREIFFAINGTIEVLTSDFDSTTIIYLMDLRAQNSADFDYVFWRFPIGQQKRIINRMAGIKEDKLRPKAELPEAKELED